MASECYSGTIMDLATMPEQTLTLRERRHEFGDIYTYFFSTESPIPYVSGQYAHVRLSHMNEGDKAVREFSFAGAPHEELICFGVDARSGSPYQKRLLEMKVGDTAGIFKIKSHMTWPPPGVTEIVMLAGGIGVTPFRSQLLDIAHRRLEFTTTLIHVGSGTHVYHDELTLLTNEYHAIGRDEFTPIVTDTVKKYPHAHYFIAGSNGFVEAGVALLSALGVTRFESDTFKGLTESV